MCIKLFTAHRQQLIVKIHYVRFCLLFYFQYVCLDKRLMCHVSPFEMETEAFCPRVQVTNTASMYIQLESVILYMSLEVPFIKLMFSNLVCTHSSHVVEGLQLLAIFSRNLQLSSDVSSETHSI